MSENVLRLQSVSLLPAVSERNSRQTVPCGCKQAGRVLAGWWWWWWGGVGWGGPDRCTGSEAPHAGEDVSVSVAVKTLPDSTVCRRLAAPPIRPTPTEAVGRFLVQSGTLF